MLGSIDVTDHDSESEYAVSPTERRRYRDLFAAQPTTYGKFQCNKYIYISLSYWNLFLLSFVAADASDFSEIQILCVSLNSIILM